MYDYVENRYNKFPQMVEENHLDNKNLYIKFVNAPYLILPDNLEDFYKMHKSKFWYNIKRSERLYNKEYGALNFEIVKSKEQLEYFLDQVFVLFNKRWEHEFTSFVWKCKDGFEKYKESMVDLSSTDEAFIAVLYNTDRELLSYAYCLEKNETIYFYQFTTDIDDKYRKYSLGKLLLKKLLENIINTKKYKTFDFMLGETPYKLEWASHSKPIYIKINNKTIGSYLKLFLIRLRLFVQFNGFLRDKIKYLFKLKEKFFEKC